jgi:hypothetical protein
MNFRDVMSMALGPFLAASGLGKTKTYELITAGEIKSFTVGKRRLIDVASYLAFMERKAKSAPALASPNPRAASRIAAQPSVNAEQHVETPRRRGRPPGSKSRPSVAPAPSPLAERPRPARRIDRAMGPTRPD